MMTVSGTKRETSINNRRSPKESAHDDSMIAIGYMRYVKADP